MPLGPPRTEGHLPRGPSPAAYGYLGHDDVRSESGMASSEFEAAVAGVKGLTDDPGNDVKLRLYALYKQATEGDVSGGRPGFTNLVGRAKHDAWAKLEGTPSGDAEAQYVAIVNDLATR